MYLLDVNKILLECAKRKLTLTDFLKNAGLSYAAFRMLKNGSKANVKTVGKLAAALCVEPEEILLKEA